MRSRQTQLQMRSTNKASSSTWTRAKSWGSSLGTFLAKFQLLDRYVDSQGCIHRILCTGHGMFRVVSIVYWRCVSQIFHLAFTLICGPGNKCKNHYCMHWWKNRSLWRYKSLFENYFQRFQVAQLIYPLRLLQLVKTIKTLDY